MFDRCKLSVIHEIYTDFTLLLPEFVCRVYQYTTMVNPSGEHAPEGNIIMRRYKDILKIFQKCHPEGLLSIKELYKYED